MGPRPNGLHFKEPLAHFSLGVVGTVSTITEFVSKISQNIIILSFLFFTKKFQKLFIKITRE